MNINICNTLYIIFRFMTEKERERERNADHGLLMPLILIIYIILLFRLVFAFIRFVLLTYYCKS